MTGRLPIVTHIERQNRSAAGHGLHKRRVGSAGAMSVNIKQALFPQHEELFLVIDRIDNMDIAEPAIFCFQLPAVGTQIPITDKYERDIRFRERLQNQMTIVFRFDPQIVQAYAFAPTPKKARISR